MKYSPREIENKWQRYWESKGVFKLSKDNSNREKFYVLDMFPYPSGEGLHMGHTESYTASDLFFRYKRMRGYDVLHPQGFDAFGLPAENYAIKTGIKPAETTKKNINTYIKQMKSLGLAYDFSEKLITSSPEYYKWTQWIFGKFFENGLVYKKTQKANWCSSCQTIIANEQVADGNCERCGTIIIQKEVPGWFFRITDFAEELIDGLDTVDWPEYTKKNQKNWIGKSEGAVVKFEIKNLNSQENLETQKFEKENSIEVFTTRLDTIFGCTYVVLAPENPWISQFQKMIDNWKEVEDYIIQAQNKTELDRLEAKEKTGIKLEGLFAINPFNKEEIPVFVADYVLAGYGTGAVMAVPAHDERDWEFAKKQGIAIKQSIASNLKDFQATTKTLVLLKEIKSKADEKNLKFWVLGGLSCAFHAGIIYRKHDDLDLIVKNVDDLEKLSDILATKNFIKNEKGEFVRDDFVIEVLPYKCSVEFDEKDFENKPMILGDCDALVLSYKFALRLKEKQLKERKKTKDKQDMAYLNGKVFSEDGVVVNSQEYTGLDSSTARKKMIEWLEKSELGKQQINYRLRDWSISRQRYWGCPIPIVYSPQGEAKFVGEENLPWKLPEDVDFVPTGVAPLAKSKELKSRVENIFGNGWVAEYDTMDTFVDSSWYFLRYPDPGNYQYFCSPTRLKRWLPVDLYIGGAEHTYMHLLFARFFIKAMQKIGLIDFNEPFLKLRHQGMVLDKYGKKMSKSKGNVVNPDEMIRKFGADSVRLYMMFAAPLEDEVVWDEKNIVGVYRFLEKVWEQGERVLKNKQEVVDKNIEYVLQATIKKVGSDIEELKYNTAVSEMMKFINVAKKSNLSRQQFENFLLILSPFAPHITEEIWQTLGHEESIAFSNWPVVNENNLNKREVEIVVQVNGKVRDKIKALVDISEDEAKKIALKSEKIKTHLTDKEIEKIIFVPGRLINIVTN